MFHTHIRREAYNGALLCPEHFHQFVSGNCHSPNFSNSDTRGHVGQRGGLFQSSLVSQGECQSRNHGVARSSDIVDLPSHGGDMQVLVIGLEEVHAIRTAGY